MHTIVKVPEGRMRGELIVDNHKFICVIGKNGSIDPREKKEGDGKSPRGIYHLSPVIYYRADRIGMPEGVQLEAVPIQEGMAWDDDTHSSTYNQLIHTGDQNHPESLWRADSLYNIVIFVQYNTNPAIPGRGSAIFIHCARPNWQGTAGCVALAEEDLLSILPLFTADSTISIEK